MLLQLRVDSDSEEKMGDELTILLEAFHKIEKAGGQATLSLSTSSGKTKVKLEIPTTAAPPFASPSTSSTPGRRHRRRGARARACRNLQAAAHQAPFSYLTLFCLIVNEISGPKRVTHHIFYSVHIHISKDRVILTIPHRISNPKSLISLQPTKAFMRLS